jgi:hypothetical protein
LGSGGLARPKRGGTYWMIRPLASAKMTLFILVG